MQLTQGNLTALFTGFRATFLEAVREAPIPKRVEDFVLILPSSKSIEGLPTVVLLGDLEELLDEYTQTALGRFLQNIPNRYFGRIIEIPASHIEDDSYGIYSVAWQRFGRLAQTHPYRRVPQLFINGFTTPWIDGTNVWSTTHLWVGGQTWSNLNNLPFSRTAYRQARLNLMTRLGPDGQALELYPTDLIIGPANLSAARAVVKADRLANGADNMDKDDDVSIVVWGALTGASAYNWFLVDNSDVKPVAVTDRSGPDLIYRNAETDNGMWQRERVEVKVRRRYGRAIAAPWVVEASSAEEDTTTTTEA